MKKRRGVHNVNHYYPPPPSPCSYGCEPCNVYCFKEVVSGKLGRNFFLTMAMKGIHVDERTLEAFNEQLERAKRGEFVGAR